MALKNYYLILGISPNNSTKEIQCAFRRLAKKFHPDKAGGGKTALFQDITEAYEVLSDPEKRKKYNQKLTEENRRQKSISEQHAPNQYVNRKKPIRPAWPETPFQRRKSMTSYGKRHGGYPFSSNVLEMDAYLTPKEAASGVVLNLEVSIPVECPWCEDTGRDFFFNCIRCHGTGFISIKKPFEIELPCGLNHGDHVKKTIAVSKENYLHLLIEVYII
jgi:DnaJ-class molecular chaperone